MWHEQYEDHCDFYLELWGVDNNAGLEQYDNGSGLGMRMKIYLGPNSRIIITPPDPDNPTPTNPGPPIDPGTPGDDGIGPIINDPEGPEPDPEPDPDPEPEPDPDPEPPPPPPQSGTWTYTIHNFSNTYATWRSDEKQLMRAGAYVASKAMQNSSMRSKVIGFTSYTNGSGGRLSESSTTVWNKLWAASEPSWNVGKDQDADVKYLYVRTGCSYIGSAAVPGNFIAICRNTYDANNYGSTSAAGNLMHEWTHCIGYGHVSSAGTTRSNSVPYKVGEFIRSVGSQYSSTADRLYPH